jgi:hypothetical protein
MAAPSQPCNVRHNYHHDAIQRKEVTREFHCNSLGRNTFNKPPWAHSLNRSPVTQSDTPAYSRNPPRLLYNMEAGKSERPLLKRLYKPDDMKEPRIKIDENFPEVCTAALVIYTPTNIEQRTPIFRRRRQSLGRELDRRMNFDVWR